jgi:hypothetical protein
MSQNTILPSTNLLALLTSIRDSEFQDGVPMAERAGNSVWVDQLHHGFSRHQAGGLMAQAVAHGWAYTDGECCSITASGMAMLDDAKNYFTTIAAKPPHDFRGQYSGLLEKDSWSVHKWSHAKGGHGFTIQLLKLNAVQIATIVPGEGSDRIEPICEENAHRIVDCVNGCMGIDPKAVPAAFAALERCIAALAANGAPNCEAVKEARKALSLAKGAQS